MESFHPTPVVPSNAPLWTEVDQGSHVLREQCGNRQLGYLQTQTTQDYYANINDDSTCGLAGVRGSVYQPLQFGRGQPGKPHYPWMAGLAQRYDPSSQYLFSNVTRGKSRGIRCTLSDDQEMDQAAERKARLLASRFLRCDGYIKYRNRQPKEKKGNKEDAKWPDHIEDAFIVALCRHPPCGRKKAKAPGEQHNDDAKAMGRNELIADYIFRNTGDVRTRKQVSSHIQVLKPFVQNEAIIMRFLATPGEGKESAASKAARKKASVYNPGSQMQTGLLQHHRNFSFPSPFDPQPEEFCMFMRSSKASETLHTYSATEGFSPSNFFVQTQAELYTFFPGLANIPAERFASGKFLALHVPIMLHSKNLVGDTELAISWVLKAPARDPSVSISSRTKLYLNGRPMYCDRAGNRRFYDNQDYELTEEMHEDWKNFTRECDAAEVSEHNDGLEVDSHGHYNSKTRSDGGMVQYYVPFSSTFWARYLYHVVLLQRQARELEHRPSQQDESTEDRQDLFHKKLAEVSSALEELTAVQEIIARTELGEARVVLTVHFSFSHATSKEAAVTKWQYLDMTGAYEDAIPLSAGGVSQVSFSASDSQESALSAQDTYGGSHDYASFDFSAPSNGHHQQTQHAYPDPSDNAANGLASPIDLHDTQATAGYNTSWLLPTSTSDLDHPASTVLDPLLPHGARSSLQQHHLHDVNSFDFSNGNISISLDSSALSPHQPLPNSSAAAAFSSAFDALDLDLVATDPLLLQPSRTTTPWMQSSTATPTDYAALFSQPHSPATAAFPDFDNGGANLADHLAAAAGGLTDTFDVNTLPNSFSLSAHQAFPGAGNTTSDLDHQSRDQSFSTLPPDTEANDVALPSTDHFSPPQHQSFNFSHHDGFSLPEKQTQDFGTQRQDSFASHTNAYASQTDVHDFAHSFEVSAENGFDVGEIGKQQGYGQGLQQQRQQQQHETWGGAGF
ncbi:hypothetical protein E4T42_02525 [Aureobasidium subglaciale]|nr:hypothetical protein E4T42_02525 [Aureobasidium subglaciale]